MWLRRSARRTGLPPAQERRLDRLGRTSWLFRAAGPSLQCSTTTNATPGEGEDVLIWDYIEEAICKGNRSGIDFVTEQKSYNPFEKGGLEGRGPFKNSFLVVTAKKWP
jgi:hypothetical protein